MAHTKGVRSKVLHLYCQKAWVNRFWISLREHKRAVLCIYLSYALYTHLLFILLYWRLIMRYYRRLCKHSLPSVAKLKHFSRGGVREISNLLSTFSPSKRFDLIVDELIHKRVGGIIETNQGRKRLCRYIFPPVRHLTPAFFMYTHTPTLDSVIFADVFLI